jgi:Glycosyl hydrolase family 47
VKLTVYNDQLHKWSFVFQPRRISYLSAIDISVKYYAIIRYLGAMPSAYELNGKQHKALLDQATKLRDKLVFAPIASGDIPLC